MTGALRARIQVCGGAALLKGETMICEIAGHTFYMHHVVCIYPFFEESAKTGRVKVMTTGGEVVLHFNTDDMAGLKRQYADFLDALHMQSDDDKQQNSSDPR
jgi:hypothetical protein